MTQKKEKRETDKTKHKGLSFAAKESHDVIARRKGILILINHLVLRVFQLICQCTQLPLKIFPYRICSLCELLVVSCLRTLDHHVDPVHPDAHVLRGLHSVCHLVDHLE